MNGCEVNVSCQTDPSHEEHLKILSQISNSIDKEEKTIVKITEDVEGVEKVVYIVMFVQTALVCMHE